MSDIPNDLFQGLKNINFSNLAQPLFHLPAYEISEIALPVPEDTILGDIKHQFEAHLQLVSEQTKLLTQQNQLLLDNYLKLKDMYDAQVLSAKDMKVDLKRSRNINKWMMAITAISMLAAVAAPIVTIMVSRWVK